MAKKKTRTQINIRLTPEEKEKIIQKAKEEKTTITALVLNSIENNITVNLDTSNYRDLVIQFRRIGNNINTILRRIHFNGYVADTDLMGIKKNQEILKEKIEKERITINHTKKDIENLTPEKLKNYLSKEGKKIPNYLIYDEIADQVNIKLRDFIQLIKDEKVNIVFISFINNFIENFYPTHYLYDELVLLSNDLSDVMYQINKKIITETGRLTEDDFTNVMAVLSKYRKDIDI